MKATELRIGNLVMAKAPSNIDGRMCKVSDLQLTSSPEEWSVRAWCIDNKYKCYGACDDRISPIPLTEDWELTYGVVRRTLMGESFTTRFIDSYGVPDWIKHVHELQNWYYWTFNKTELELTK